MKPSSRPSRRPDKLTFLTTATLSLLSFGSNARAKEIEPAEPDPVHADTGTGLALDEHFFEAPIDRAFAGGPAEFGYQWVRSEPPCDPPLGAGPVQSATNEPPLNPTGRDLPMWAPLRDNNFVVGELDFVLKRDGEISVAAADLRALLLPVLSPGGMALLDRAIAGRANVTASDIAASGFVLAYNRQDLSLAITIPAEARPTTTLHLSGNEPVAGTFEAPARTSAFLNMRGSIDQVDSETQNGFEQAEILFEFAARSHGVVLESEGSYFGDATQPFRREGTRFLYDDIPHTTRYTLGDLKPQGRGYVALPPMSGISVVKSTHLLDPYRSVQPSGRRTFTLSRPSTVEASVNGQFVQRFRLDPGTYNLEDFPLTSGRNDVHLSVEDDGGGREDLDFSVFFSQNILQAGESEYGFFAGVESQFNGSGRDYQTDSYVASGFYEKGLSPRITAGVNFQVQAEGWLVGADGALQTPVGLFGVQAAASQNDSSGDGYAAYASFSTGIDFSPDYGLGLSVSAETRSDKFAAPNLTAQINRFEYEASASAGLSLPYHQYVSVGARFSRAFTGFDDESFFRVAYGASLTRRLGVRVDGTRRVVGDEEETGVGIEFVYQLGDDSSLSASHETVDHSTRISYDTARGYGVGSWSAGADYTTAGDTSGASVSFSQILNRTRWGVSHFEQLETPNSGTTERRTSLRAASALVYADGAFAVSRPVIDSFAIVRPHSSLHGAPVILEPSDEGYSAKSGLFGPAVLPELGAFAPQTITYDVPDAPEGYDLGASTLRVRPPYQSGYLRTVGSDYSLSAIGRLVDGFGDAVVLQGGRAIELANPNRAPIVVFTNRDGRFGAYGLRPGRWRIEMPNHLNYILEVPTDPAGLVQAGTLTPESAP